MHVHALSKESFEETYEEFRKHNVVKAIISGSLEHVEFWMSRDVDNRLIPCLFMFKPDMDLGKFENLLKSGKIKVFGELVALSAGLTLSDPVWDTYLKLCSQYDIPVFIHSGKAYMDTSFKKARLSLGDPYLIESVLIRYPKLKVVLCHCGGEWHEHALVLMVSYPQVYSDLAWILWVDPNAMRYAREFMANAKIAGCLDRVMFGSDICSIVPTHVLGDSIVYLNNLSFLSEKDKRDILYNNAARFLKLEN